MSYLDKGIIFRDRPLKQDEQYHHVCQKCGAEIHPDLVQSHKCPLLNFIPDRSDDSGR